jgi:5-methylcytosine-specific restriction endonuclease McrA
MIHLCYNEGRNRNGVLEHAVSNQHTGVICMSAIPDSITFPKQCPKCKTQYPDASIAFSKSKSRKDGYNGWCKACIANYRREHAEELKQKHHQDHQRRMENPEYRERRNATTRVYKRENAEKVKASAIAYRARNRARRTDYNRSWFAEHDGYVQRYGKDWRAQHPEKGRLYKARRRARLLAAEGTHTTADILAQLKRQKGRCYYAACGHCKLGDAYHLEHVIPLSRGGRNDPSNLVLACPKCNLSKNDKLPHEWCDGGRLL